MTIHHLFVGALSTLGIVLLGAPSHAASVDSTPATANELVQLEPGPTPNPALSPGEVVKIQLNALRENDDSDHGIAVCFRFASPSNKSNTGPVERFGQMIKLGPYRLMLFYHDAHYGEIEILNDKARQRVTLKGTSETITYAFYLSRQTLADCEGCWMTDAVTIERVENNLSAKYDNERRIEI